MPFRISLTGTNAWVGLATAVILLFFFCCLLGAGSWLLYIERPGELGEPAAGKLRLCPPRRLLGRRSGGGRRRRRGALSVGLCGLFAAPEKELRAGVVVEAGFKHLDERLPVHLIERECEPERDDGGGKHDSEEKREENEEGDSEASGAGEIDELPQGQRPDDPVLHFNKLRHLVLHTLISIATKTPLPGNDTAAQPMRRLKRYWTKAKKGPASTKAKMSRKRMSEKAPPARIWFSKRINPPEKRQGRSARSVVKPSKGGIGMRLKSPRKRFTKTIVPAMESAGAERPRSAPKRTM